MLKRCIQNKCNLEVFEEHQQCILHYSGKNTTHVEEFKSVIEKLIYEGYNFFDSIQFPSGYNSFPEKIEFNDAKFFDCEFASGFIFQKTKFTGITTFERNVFNHDVDFLTCEIQDDFSMSANYYSKQLFFSHLKTMGDQNKITIQNLDGFKPEYVSNKLLFDSCNFLNTKLKLRNMTLKSASWKFIDNDFDNSELIIEKVSFIGHIEFIKGDNNRDHGNKFRSSVLRVYNSSFEGFKTVFGSSTVLDDMSKMLFYNVYFAADKTSFRKFNFPNPSHFERCRFSGNVDFTDSFNVSNCFFKRSNIEDINFDGANWSKDFKVLDETRIIEEFSTKSSKEKRDEYRSASITYRRLKLNLEKRMDFLDSSKFYVREKECIRKSMPWYKQVRHQFLRITCDYGENLPKVIYWTFATIFGFGFLYLFNGFTYKGIHINYDFTLTYINFEFNDLVLAVWLSAKSMLIVLRQLGDFSIPSTWVSILRDLESVFGAFLIGLFVFVFRRQLRK